MPVSTVVTEFLLPGSIGERETYQIEKLQIFLGKTESQTKSSKYQISRLMISNIRPFKSQMCQPFMTQFILSLPPN